MENQAAVNALKQAILLERRGGAFYRKVADQAEKDPVKQFFDLMAREEELHEQILVGQLKVFNKSGRFEPLDGGSREIEGVAAKVITREIAQALSAAGFEAAAVSAAMALEKNAVRLYAERAEATADPEEKALYDWLAKWEQSHLEFLAELDREITESVWFDNSFWPF
ncbi:MAG: ferritin-like domain-containing protein [Desulfobacterales bacterium]